MCILRRGKTFLYKIHPVAFDFSIPSENNKKERYTKVYLSFLVTRTGIEPMLPP